MKKTQILIKVYKIAANPLKKKFRYEKNKCHFPFNLTGDPALQNEIFVGLKKKYRHSSLLNKDLPLKFFFIYPVSCVISSTQYFNKQDISRKIMLLFQMEPLLPTTEHVVARTFVFCFVKCQE